jgi:hypothetical protein
MTCSFCCAADDLQFLADPDVPSFFDPKIHKRYNAEHYYQHGSKEHKMQVFSYRRFVSG